MSLAIIVAERRLAEEGLILEEDVARAATADWGRPRHDMRSLEAVMEG
jgi:hypothetical protein